MAIEKNNFKVSRFDSEFSPRSRDTNTMLSSEDEEFQRKNLSAVESDDDEDDDFDDRDSGAGSDDIDLLEFGEAGEEFCQVGDQTCSIPVELYDLSGLHDVLSVDAWNEVLTEEERFHLSQYLPDMDQENFLRTLMELLTGCNLHFGSPINKLFDMLKGGLCEPRVALYRQGLSFFQKREHYHLLRKHQNTMVSNLCQMKDAWLNCKGYSIEEKLQVLNIMRSQNSLMFEKMEELKSDSSEMEESVDGMWGKRAKDRKLGQKLARQSGYSIGSASDYSSLAMPLAVEPAKPGKQNKKGALKPGGPKTAVTKELVGGNPSVHHGAVPLFQHNRMTDFDSGISFHMGNQMMANDGRESMYDVSVHRDQNFSRTGVSSRAGTLKMGKKHEGLRVEDYTENFMGRMYGKNKTVNQLSDIKVLTSKPPNARISHDFGKKLKIFPTYQQHPSEDLMSYGKGRIPDFPLNEAQMEAQDVNAPLWLGKKQGGPFFAEQSNKYGDWNPKSKKLKSGRDSSGLGFKGLYDFELQPKAVPERVRESSIQNGGRAVMKHKGVKAYAKINESDSDSSEQVDEEEDDNPLLRSKWAYPSGFPGLTFGEELKRSKLVEKDMKDGIWTLDGSSHSSRQISDYNEHLRMMKNGNSSWRAEQKGKMHDIGHIQPSAGDLNEKIFLGSGRLTGEVDWQQSYKLARNGLILGDQSGRLHLPAFGAPNLEGNNGELYAEYGLPQSTFLPQDNNPEDDDSILIKSLAGNAKVSARLGKKGQAYAAGRFERSDAQLMGCNSVTKKRKKKDDGSFLDGGENKNYSHTDNQLQIEDIDSSKKHGKRKAGDDTDTLEKGVNELPVTEVEIEDVEPDNKPQKKHFTLITPTFHSGFSFSIIHLLTAVQMAMITVASEDSSQAGKLLDQCEGTPIVKEGQDMGQASTNGNHPNADSDVNNSEASPQMNIPSLTVQEIVNRVKANPGDPSILDTQEPLQDLVRGVLKILSSKTAPLGAKGWKQLVVYEKTSKSWSWNGPVNHSPSDPETADELTSADAWGLPHKMLVKLVDSFANWLKNGQETLQQIGSLPTPPLSLLQFNLDEKERFKDLRAQKSLSTISPSSEEVRSYFRKEEVLRYSIPDRAFTYTAVDGKKSIVAPLRRCGGKPTSKARDHFMLKRDRPPHVTILCLVRDAAARLPGSIGTRADVCTLIRDSQYIVEDVSDAQVNQVVSGALDRLHYERDPCVQFDGERKLWVYLHREREEEDFEDDGTSSTKKWKRQRKEANEPSEQEAVTVAFPGAEEQAGLDLSYDLNIKPSSMDDEDKKAETMLYDAAADNVDDVEKNVEMEMGQGSLQIAGDPDGPAVPMVWDPVTLNSMQDSSQLLCQENSTNEDFDDEIFGREPPA